MPSQRPKRFLIEINFDDKWHKEVYTDWYHQAFLIAVLYIGIHKTRIRDTHTRQIVWEIE